MKTIEEIIKDAFKRELFWGLLLINGVLIVVNLSHDAIIHLLDSLTLQLMLGFGLLGVLMIASRRWRFGTLSFLCATLLMIN